MSGKAILTPETRYLPSETAMSDPLHNGFRSMMSSGFPHQGFAAFMPACFKRPLKFKSDLDGAPVNLSGIAEKSPVMRKIVTSACKVVFPDTGKKNKRS